MNLVKFWFTPISPRLHPRKKLSNTTPTHMCILHICSKNSCFAFEIFFFLSLLEEKRIMLEVHSVYKSIRTTQYALTAVEQTSMMENPLWLLQLLYLIYGEICTDHQHMFMFMILADCKGVQDRPSSLKCRCWNVCWQYGQHSHLLVQVLLDDEGKRWWAPTLYVDQINQQALRHNMQSRAFNKEYELHLISISFQSLRSDWEVQVEEKHITHRSCWIGANVLVWTHNGNTYKSLGGFLLPWLVRYLWWKQGREIPVWLIK